MKQETKIAEDNPQFGVQLRVIQKPYYQDDLVTIYNNDCLLVMPALRPIDVIITDPPYGIKAAGKGFANGTSKNLKMYEQEDWDAERPQRVYFEMMKYVSRHQIIFGGNYYLDYLEATRSMIFWNKRTGENSYADGELAWTNFDRVVKMYDLSWVGANAKDKFSKREHPTQKPLELMTKIIEDYTNASDLILDPFMGSGTTLVAAKALGRKAIGIEINKQYCDIAVKRLAGVQLRMLASV